MKKRVVITGMGIVSPLGCDIEKYYENLLSGNTNFSYADNLKYEYETRSLVSLVADDFESECEKFGLTTDRNLVNFISLAGLKAIEQAGAQKTLDKVCNNVGLFIGSSKNYLFDSSQFIEDLSKEEAQQILKDNYPADILKDVCNILGTQGDSILLPIACSGGNVAVSLAASRIELGKMDMAIAGGADIFNELCYAIFNTLGAMSKTTCSPFSKERDGITIGEGAGFVILESLDSAQERGANILGEITGYSMYCDAYHLNTPDPQGIMAAKSIEKSIENSKLKVSEIDCISPHGTGTYSNDLQEANAIYSIFGDSANTIPISATKSSLGHCMGAASAMEMIASIKSLETNTIPSTINTIDDSADPGFKFKPLLGDFSSKEVQNILSSSFAFGGNISSVILSKYD